MILSSLLDLLTNIGVGAGAITAVLVLIGIVMKSPLGGWIKRQVSEDIIGFIGGIAESVAIRALRQYEKEQDGRLAAAFEAHGLVRHDDVVTTLDEQLPRHLSPVMDRLDSIDARQSASIEDRKLLHRKFDEQIARTKAAEKGYVEDRETG